MGRVVVGRVGSDGRKSGRPTSDVWWVLLCLASAPSLYPANTDHHAAPFPTCSCADTLLRNVYRWICNPAARLYDPALKRVGGAAAML